LGFTLALPVEAGRRCGPLPLRPAVYVPGDGRVAPRRARRPAAPAGSARLAPRPARR